MLQRLFVSFLLSSILFSCFPKYDREPVKKVLGYKPIFTKDTSILKITADTARPVKNAGKIYALDHLIYQNELGEGIHVLDNTDPSNLRNIGFIRVKGNSEMSIRENHLYVNSFTDLVIVDIKDWRQPKEVRRLKHVFQQGNSVSGSYTFIPLPEKNVYFECHSLYSRDQVQTGWEKDSIYDNNCFYR